MKLSMYECDGCGGRHKQSNAESSWITVVEDKDSMVISELRQVECGKDYCSPGCLIKAVSKSRWGSPTLVVYHEDTLGTPSTSGVVGRIDTATGLPLPPNGGSIVWANGSAKILS